MNGISDELLRDALGRAAATVTPEDLQPLTAPARGHRRVLTLSLGAVAALSLVVLATLVRPSARSAPTSPAQRQQPRMTLAAYAGVKYVLIGGGTLGKPVSVHNAATGKKIASVPSPAGQKGYWDVAGTGDNRTFLLSAFDHTRDVTHVYRLRLHDDGAPERPKEFTTIKGERALGEHMLAGASGGARLAFVTETGVKAKYTATGGSAVFGSRAQDKIVILGPATGDRREVALPRGEMLGELAWAPDGRRLVYTTGGPVQRGLTLVDPATGARHPIQPAPGVADLGNVVMDQDSDNLVTVVFSQGKVRMLWYSLSTQKITKQVPLTTYHFPDTPASMGPFMSGDTVVVLVGDTVYRVTGKNVRTQHADAKSLIGNSRIAAW